MKYFSLLRNVQIGSETHTSSYCKSINFIQYVPYRAPSYTGQTKPTNCTCIIYYFYYCTYIFSVYMTILRVLIECISVVMCKVKKYILKYDVKTEHRVMAKKLKFVKIFMCPVWCCVHCVVVCALCGHQVNYHIYIYINIYKLISFLFLSKCSAWKLDLPSQE